MGTVNQDKMFAVQENIQRRSESHRQTFCEDVIGEGLVFILKDQRRFGKLGT